MNVNYSYLQIAVQVRKSLSTKSLTPPNAKLTLPLWLLTRRKELFFPKRVKSQWFHSAWPAICNVTPRDWLPPWTYAKGVSPFRFSICYHWHKKLSGVTKPANALIDISWGDIWTYMSFQCYSAFTMSPFPCILQGWLHCFAAILC